MLKIDGQMVGDSKIIAESFNDIFSDIGAKLDAEIPVGESSFRQYLKNKVLIFINPVCESAVKEELMILNPRKACGPDNYSPKIVRASSAVVIRPLTLLCYASIYDRVNAFFIPNLWWDVSFTATLFFGIIPKHRTYPIYRSYQWKYIWRGTLICYGNNFCLVENYRRLYDLVINTRHPWEKYQRRPQLCRMYSDLYLIVVRIFHNSLSVSLDTL